MPCCDSFGAPAALKNLLRRRRKKTYGCCNQSSRGLDFPLEILGIILHSSPSQGTVNHQYDLRRHKVEFLSSRKTVGPPAVLNNIPNKDIYGRRSSRARSLVQIIILIVVAVHSYTQITQITWQSHTTYRTHCVNQQITLESMCKRMHGIIYDRTRQDESQAYTDFLLRCDDT